MRESWRQPKDVSSSDYPISKERHGPNEAEERNTVKPKVAKTCWNFNNLRTDYATTLEAKPRALGPGFVFKATGAQAAKARALLLLAPAAESRPTREHGAEEPHRRGKWRDRRLTGSPGDDGTAAVASHTFSDVKCAIRLVLFGPVIAAKIAAAVVEAFINVKSTIQLSPTLSPLGPMCSSKPLKTPVQQEQVLRCQEELQDLAAAWR